MWNSVHGQLRENSVGVAHSHTQLERLQRELEQTRCDLDVSNEAVNELNSTQRSLRLNLRMTTEELERMRRRVSELEQRLAQRAKAEEREREISSPAHVLARVAEPLRAEARVAAGQMKMQVAALESELRRRDLQAFQDKATAEQAQLELNCTRADLNASLASHKSMIASLTATQAEVEHVNARVHGLERALEQRETDFLREQALKEYLEREVKRERAVSDSSF